jgi:hypothetical protein
VSTFLKKSAVQIFIFPIFSFGRFFPFYRKNADAKQEKAARETLQSRLTLFVFQLPIKIIYQKSPSRCALAARG